MCAPMMRGKSAERAEKCPGGPGLKFGLPISHWREGGRPTAPRRRTQKAYAQRNQTADIGEPFAVVRRFIAEVLRHGNMLLSHPRCRTAHQVSPGFAVFRRI